MAIELDTYSEPQVVKISSFMGRTDWIVNGVEADATTAKEVKPAPGTGKHLYLQKAVLQCETAAVDPQLQDNATSAIVLLGPMYSTTSGNSIKLDLPEDEAIKVAANQAIDLKAAGAGAVFVFIKGFTAEG